MTKAERYKNIIAWFEENQPSPTTELRFDSNFQLLVAVMLSAQCTDKRVNMVTPALFAKYPTPQKMAQASVNDIFSLVKSVSYPNAKANHLKEMAQQLISNFGGEVPSDIDALQTLQGVGRKTANVMLAVAFHQNAMPVDTHVFRVSNRLGLVKTTTPLATEKELVKNIPNNFLSKAHHWILLHGRYVCTARNPHCTKCGISDWCKFHSAQKSEKGQV